MLLLSTAIRKLVAKFIGCWPADVKSELRNHGGFEVRAKVSVIVILRRLILLCLKYRINSVADPL